MENLMLAGLIRLISMRLGETIDPELQLSWEVMERGHDNA
jgi:hypothetical protein